MSGSDQYNISPSHSKKSRITRKSALALVLALSVSTLATAAHADEDDSAAFSFEPTSGAPGVVVWVNGSGFSSENQVLFGGVAVSYELYTESSLAFVVPELAAGNYAVEVVADEDDTASVCCFTILDENDTQEEVPAEEPPQDQAPPAVEDLPCRESGMNMQCNILGTIKMPNQRNIKGEPVQIISTIVMDQTFADQGGRFVLFSVRNVTDDGDSPVVIGLNGFHTPAGDIITTRIENKGKHEMNIWVHAMDIPVGVPITLDLTVGSTNRGAYILETLVMVFDRGYEPVMPGGEEASLYSYTLLGVNDETRGDFGMAGGPRVSVPAPGFALSVLALAGIALFVTRRRSA